MAATIVSSTYVLGHTQIDGTRYVQETHTWDSGLPSTVLEYGPVPDTVDHQAIANARAVQIMLSKAESEFTERLVINETLSLVYQTGSQLADRFWERLKEVYRRGDKIEFARMIWWLHARVVAGDFTSNDVRLTFNAAYNRSLTLAQWNNFVTNTLVPIKDRYQAMLDQADL